MKCRTFVTFLLVIVLGLVTLGNCQEKSKEEETKGKIQKEQVESESVKAITAIPSEIDSTGFVGIYITETETGEGTQVDDVVPDGPAAKAGIKKGDIIIELDGKKITDEEFVLKEIAKTKPAQKVNFKIKRKGKTIQITLETTTRPKSTAEETPIGLINKIEQTLRGDKNNLGIKTVDIVPGLDEYFNVESGALIIEVMANSLSDKLGIKPGDVIVGIDETNVSDSRTLKSIMKKKQSGATITIKLMRHKKTMMVKGILESE
jgi:S1-C subfamily serine protease